MVHPLLDGWVGVVEMNEELVQRVLEGGAPEGLHRRRAKEANPASEHREPHVVGGVVEAFEEGRVEFRDGLLAQGPGEGAEDPAEAQGAKLPGGRVVVVQVRLEHREELRGDFEEDLAVRVAPVEHRVEAGDGHLADRRLGLARLPHHAVREGVLDQRHHERRPVAGRLRSRQQGLEEAEHVEFEVGLVLGLDMGHYHGERPPQHGCVHGPGARAQHRVEGPPRGVLVPPHHHPPAR
mmetsp:Transcript_26962/g.60307  ORF Transcript_26962/g.60307 Transcript_26962/m.60307 type:complete len:237 (-) Transcript_26962:509-1219(-)